MTQANPEGTDSTPSAGITEEARARITAEVLERYPEFAQPLQAYVARNHREYAAELAERDVARAATRSATLDQQAEEVADDAGVGAGEPMAAVRAEPTKERKKEVTSDQELSSDQEEHAVQADFDQGLGQLEADFAAFGVQLGIKVDDALKELNKFRTRLAEVGTAIGTKARGLDSAGIYALRKRFDALDARLDTRIAELNVALNETRRLGEEFEALKASFDELDGGLDAMAGEAIARLTAFKRMLAELGTAIGTRVNTELYGAVDTGIGELSKRYNALRKTLDDRIAGHYAEFNQKLRAIEVAFDAFEARLNGGLPISAPGTAEELMGFSTGLTEFVEALTAGSRNLDDAGYGAINARFDALGGRLDARIAQWNEETHGVTALKARVREFEASLGVLRENPSVATELHQLREGCDLLVANIDDRDEFNVRLRFVEGMLDELVVTLSRFSTTPAIATDLGEVRVALATVRSRRLGDEVVQKVLAEVDAPRDPVKFDKLGRRGD